jgi:hypothetical protein
MRGLVLAFAFLLTPLAANAQLRVDINQDNGRSDVLAPGWVSWRVQQKETAAARFGDVTATLRAVGPGTKLATASAGSQTSSRRLTSNL